MGSGRGEGQGAGYFVPCISMEARPLSAVSSPLETFCWQAKAAHTHRTGGAAEAVSVLELRKTGGGGRGAKKGGGC